MAYYLVKLEKKYKRQLVEMLDEWLEDINKNHGNTSPWVVLMKNDYHDFDNYLANLENKEEKNGLVPDSTYFLYDSDNDSFVGAVNIRHKLNERLLFDGGHIGDGIRPSRRKQGFGSLIIKLALEKCKELGINKVLLVCDADNLGSKKTIINNGGILENEVTDSDGNKELRYWINL